MDNNIHNIFGISCSEPVKQNWGYVKKKDCITFILLSILVVLSAFNFMINLETHKNIHSHQSNQGASAIHKNYTLEDLERRVINSSHPLQHIDKKSRVHALEFVHQAILQHYPNRWQVCQDIVRNLNHHHVYEMSQGGTASLDTS